MTTKEKLNKAFRLLRKDGFFAKANNMCCQSCGCAALPEGTVNYVFYHKQDLQAYNKTKKMCLTWGGNGDIIVTAMQLAGLTVTWDGNARTRILVE